MARIRYFETEECKEKWSELEKITSPEVASAMKELYSLYDFELVEWVANLYDPKIGGFYFSNTARDLEEVTYNGKTTKLLPDVESTLQAFNFLIGSGIAADGYEKFLPEKMKKKIGEWVYSLQDEDGFFYHPQWGKDITVSRRARDFSWSKAILGTLGIKTKYPTIEDTGSGKANEKTLIPDHLKSKEAFLEYLEGLKLNEASYPAGNTLAAQFVQIKSQGLDGMLIDYLNAHQNENGHWHHTTNYYAINGLMKISGPYNYAKKPLPRAKEAAYSALAAIGSGEPFCAITELWNIWVSFTNINRNLRDHGGKEGQRAADEITAAIRRDAAKAIKTTKEQVAEFKRPDFGFGYHKNLPCTHSQGMPVTTNTTADADLNGNLMATTHMIMMIYNALEVPEEKRVPLFGKAEGERFLEIINENMKKAGI